MTKDQAQQHLDAWLAADLAVSQGTSYSIAGRSLSRESAAEIRNAIAYWSKIVAQFDRKDGSGISVKVASFK